MQILECLPGNLEIIVEKNKKEKETYLKTLWSYKEKFKKKTIFINVTGKLDTSKKAFLIIDNLIH